MEIEEFGPDDAAAVAAYTEVCNAVDAQYASWRDPVTPEAMAGELRWSWDLEPGTPYLAREGGAVVAVGRLASSAWDNPHLAFGELRVAPPHQRRGHGASLLQHLEAQVRQQGRSVLAFAAVDHEAAASFAIRHGYREVYVEVARRQLLGDLDRSALDAAYDDARPHASAYDLQRRHLPTPVDDLPAVAEMTAAINDAPTDELSIEDEVYTADRIRDYETAQLSQQRRMYQVVARHRESGALAGHTVVAVLGDRPHIAEQHDTAVAPTHRGHRLGFLLKAEMLRWLREIEPQLHHIDTDNAGSNAHMIGINEMLGYRVAGRIPYYERTLT